MSALQFWIRGDLHGEQRRRLEEIGIVAVPVAAGGRPTDADFVGAAWTRIEAGAGEAESERTRIADAIGTAPELITGPYAVH